MTRRSALRLGAAAAALAAAALTAELALRRIDPVGTRLATEMRAFQSRLSWDTVVFYRMAPGTRLAFRDWTLEVNRDGLRGPALPPTRPEGVFRVLLLGDSVALGWGVPWEDTVGARLAPLLEARRGTPVEVVTSAVSSWNSVAEARELQARLARLDPDAVILLYVNNDADLHPEVAERDHGQSWPETPPPQGWRALAWVRSIQGLAQLRASTAAQRGTPGTSESPFDPRLPGAQASVTALGAAADLCRDFHLPFSVVSYGSDPAMRALLRSAATAHRFTWWDYSADFPPEYLRLVRNSPLDAHFDRRGHERLASHIAASASVTPDWLAGRAQTARVTAVSARGLLAETSLPWGSRWSGGLEITTAPPTATIVTLARACSGTVRLSCVPPCLVEPAQLDQASWQPLRITLDPSAAAATHHIESTGDFETTPLLTRSSVR